MEFQNGILNGILNGISKNGILKEFQHTLLKSHLKISNGILNGIFKWNFKRELNSVHKHNCGFHLLVYIFYHHNS